MKCLKCEFEGEPSEFSKSKKRGMKLCNSCWTAYRRDHEYGGQEEYRRSGKHAEAQQRYHETDKYKETYQQDYERRGDQIRKNVRARKIKNQFGLSVEGYEERRTTQGDLCGLCFQPMNKVVKGHDALDPVLDHNHKTKDLRAFVHRKCNAALGMFKDDIKMLEMALAYLKRY
jgi:hypothetical protein